MALKVYLEVFRLSEELVENSMNTAGHGSAIETMKIVKIETI